MPALASPSTWRTHPYTYTGYLYVDRPPAVFKARINQAAFSYPLTQLSFDGVTVGAYTDVTKNMTVLVGTSEGADDLGRTRVRKAATSSVLYIGESSQGTHDGEVNPQDDAYITVLEEYRLWTIPPRIADDGTNYKDYDIPYTEGGRNYGSRPGPIANGGPWRAALVDPDTGVAAFDFSASDSLAVSPGSAISTYAWDVGDGTITTGTSSSQDITATFPAGRRYVDLTVTDDNGDSRTHHILTVALDADDATWKPITRFEIVEQRLTREGGALTAIIHQDLPPATYPDGCAVIYFEEEVYGGTAGSLAGPSTVGGVKFVGWHDTQSESPRMTLQGLERGTELRCISTAAAMRRRNILPQEVLDDDTPSSWRQMDTFTTGRFMMYQLAWHSTVLDVAPFVLEALGSAYPGLSVAASTLWDQVQEIAGSLGQVLTCDQRGVLRVLDDPMLQDSGSRTSTVIISLDGDDYGAYTLEQDRHPRQYWMAGEGQTTGAAVSDIYCRAPGLAPGQGAERIDMAQQLVASQTALNARIGHAYARANSPWLPGRVSLVHTGDAGIDPALLEWVEWTVASNTNRRGLALTDERCLPSEVAIRHSLDRQGRAVKDVDVTLEIETTGTPAVTVIIPEDAVSDFEDWYPSWEPIPFDPLPEGGSGDLTALEVTQSPAMYASGSSGIARNRTPGAPSPAWEIVLEAADFGGNPIDGFLLDPWDPKNGAYVMVRDGASGPIELYYVDNLNGSPGSQTVTLRATSSVGANGQIMAAAIDREGFVAIGTRETAGAVSSYVRSMMLDGYGDSAFSEVRPGELVSRTDPVVPGIALGTKGTQTMYMSTDSWVYKSANLGASWSQLLSATWPIIKVPYDSNPTDSELYYVAGNIYGAGTDLCYYDGSTLHTRALPATYTMTPYYWDSLHVATFAKTRVAVMTPQGRLLTSDDGGQTWTVGAAAIDVGGGLSTGTNIYGWPWDTDFFVTSRLEMTDDAGDTIQSVVGDWDSAVGWARTSLHIDIVWVP